MILSTEQTSKLRSWYRQDLLAEANRYKDWHEVRSTELHTNIQKSMESELTVFLRSKNWRFSSVKDNVLGVSNPNFMCR